MRLCACLAVACLVVGCASLGEHLADQLYGDLDTPKDSESAITTTSYPPSADVRAVIGGKGEGVDCSIPPVLEKLMFERLKPFESSVSLEFRQGCVYHDLCYRHGYATYGYTQADCDFALLQQSFRTCMQIFGSAFLVRGDGDGGSTTEICEKRAREVLLGVRLGGRSSFKARDLSTFYEFDPMPQHAEEFSVARLASIDPAGAPRVGGKTLLATVTVFRFKHGRVLRRQLMWSAHAHIGDADRRDDEGAAFPATATPTPPEVVRMDGSDWFIWVTRGSTYTTGFDSFATPARTWQPKLTLHHLRCPITTGGYKCDFDASIVRLARTWKAQEDHAEFFGFSHRYSNHTAAKPHPEPRTVGLHHWRVDAKQIEGSDSGRPKLVAAKVSDISKDRYRFLQSDPIVGDFRKPGCTEVMALGRGIAITEAGTVDEDASEAGSDFQHSTVAALIGIDEPGCPPSARFLLSLPQSWEPAVPVRNVYGQVDRLLALSTLMTPGLLRAFEFAAGHSEPDEVTPRHGSAPLDASWAQLPAYVVRGDRGDRLFFSRVVLEPSQESLMASPTAAPDHLNLEFRYFDWRDEQWMESGAASCRVDLVAQAALQPHRSVPFTLYKRLATESVKNPQGPEARALFSRMYRKELVRLWKQTQVIPGYIFPRSADAHPLDVALVFHDSADYSVLLKGVTRGNGGENGLALASPSGKFRFVNCE